MSRQERLKKRLLSWVVVALTTLAMTPSVGAAPTLEAVAKGINVDVNQISVSGISSGGFMAHQFHVAHSEHIMGAGIVAGGPYYCARGNILDAVTRCSSFVMLECKKLNLDPKWCQKTDLAPKTAGEVRRVAKESFREAKKQEASGDIGKLTNLADDKIYLFSGTYDAIVPQGVMDAVYHFYVDNDKGGVDPKNVDQNAAFPARHTMVRDSFDKPTGNAVGDCVLPPTPAPPTDKNSFIDDCTQVANEQQNTNGCICTPATTATGTPCPPPNKVTVCKDLNDVDLAGAILKRIYGAQALKNDRVAVQESEVQAFDQKGVFKESWTAPYKPMNAWLDASMAREGYLFVPKACQQGKPCKLHVAFHGCLQGDQTDKRPGHSGNLFSKYAGYNEWAAANDIIVLYPQVMVRNSGPINPQGCWDWWGQDYTHEGYYTKRGRQIKAVAKMINIFAGGQELLDVPLERP